ncbi:hypothetical protein [Thioalkalivibrio sp. ALMg11]|uniref:hypothetical protein n=1 Tax=Thioalkalivibrio sp. ALMg11 TaxID=1158165 RepID=UPI00036CB0B0|nr:hypothetical protein [Thioalkalivibrio sp. ALMg11]
MLLAKTFTLGCHARERVGERFPSETPERIEQALQAHGVVTSSAPSGDLVNVAFWSVPHAEPGIAVTNRFTGEVLTVMQALHPELGCRVLLTDGLGRGASTWHEHPRWADLRFAAIQALGEVPEGRFREALEEWEARAAERKAEALAAQKAREHSNSTQEPYLATLRFVTREGQAKVLRAGAESRVWAANASEAERALPALMLKLIARGVSLSELEAMSVEIAPNPKVAEPPVDSYELPLMAHGIAGDVGVEAFEKAQAEAAEAAQTA